MKNLMVDLETLDNVATAAILSIGACFFCPETCALGPAFYTVVNTMDCINAGLSVSAETVAWWHAQSESAREVIKAAEDPRAASVSEALRKFSAWIAETCPLEEVKVWGNGSDFDQPILQHAYRAVGRKLPWKFYNNRCFRTLKNLVGRRYCKPVMPVNDGAHNAVHDAIYQAKCAILLLRQLDAGESLYETAAIVRMEREPGRVFVNLPIGVDMYLSEFSSGRISDGNVLKEKFLATHASIDSEGRVTLGGTVAFPRNGDMDAVAERQRSPGDPEPGTGIVRSTSGG